METEKKIKWLLILVAILLTGILYMTYKTASILENGRPVTQVPAAQQPTAQQPSAQLVQVPIHLGRPEIVGDIKEGVIAIVEFGDYQCPFCKKFFQETEPTIRKKYVEPGKIVFIYKDFPLRPIHPFAQKAAEAAKCFKGGTYRVMHDYLFEHQEDLSVDALKRYAVTLQVSSSADFNDCLDKGEMATQVEQELQEGKAAQVSGTPGFVVGRVIKKSRGYLVEGKHFDGAYGIETFDQVIRELQNG